MINLLSGLGHITRWIQATSPNRPVKGLSRVTMLATRHLPAYEGVITLPDGPRFFIDTAYSAEAEILIRGMYQTALNAALTTQIQPGSYCMDIGANIGYFTTMMAHRCGPQGRVAAFEANPALVTRIQRNATLNQFDHVLVQQQAIDRTSGTVQFHITRQPGKSSLHNQRNAPVQEVLTVDATTIDQFISAAGWDRLDVIKMDIEGNDCNALLGGQESIRRFRPFIAMEYWHTTPPDIAEACFRFLIEQGYTCQSLALNGQQMPVDVAHLPNRDTDIICYPA
jgi:FkbM family methyltransferase